MVKVCDLSLVDPFPWPIVRGMGRDDNRPVIGWDTETDQGRATLIADGRGNNAVIRTFRDLLNFFFMPYSAVNPSKSLNFFFNLEYDHNAILKLLPDHHIRRVASSDRCRYLGCEISIIKGKCLTLRYKGRTSRFFDISRFYSISRDERSGLEDTYARVFGPGKFKKSLKGKHSFPANSISPEDIEYCIGDARACQDLVAYFVKVSRQFFNVRNYYSPASLGKALIRRNLWAETYQFIPSHAQDAALRCFGGARIETLKRGHMDKCYLMDISSAYPWAMTQLKDCGGVEIVRAEYIPDSKHSFFRVDVEIPEDWEIGPLRHMLKGQVVYPVGTLKGVPLTKVELELLAAYGVDFRIRYGVHIIGSGFFHPFEYMRDVYRERMRLKSENDPRQIPLKLALNASYGSLIESRKVRAGSQSDPDPLCESSDFSVDGRHVDCFTQRFRAGPFFNPVYASEVTALIRCKLFTDSFKRAESVVFYATDCICADRPLKLDFMDPKKPSMGSYELVGPYEGCVIGCGLYTFWKGEKAVKSGGRGFGRAMDVRPYLTSSSDHIRISRGGPRKLKESRLDLAKFNVFRDFGDAFKTLNLNFDKKRLWDDVPYSFKDLADSLIGSSPHNVSNLANLPLINKLST